MLCSIKERESKGSRLFFYLVAIVCLVFVMIMSLSACGDSTNGENITENNYNKIVFVLNNGEEDVECKSFEDIPIPKRSGFIFIGWFLDKNLDEEATNSLLKDKFDSAPNTESDLKVYAKWQKIADFENISMPDASFPYDGSPHSLSIVGLPANAEVSFAGEYEFINAGEFEICATISKFGYNDLTLHAKLTIEKADVDLSDIKFESKTAVWDGNKHFIEIVGELPSFVTVSYENNGNTDVGEYEVIARFTANENYKPIADMTAYLNIEEKVYNISFVEEGATTVKSVGHGKDLLDVPSPKPKRGYSVKWRDVDLTNVQEDITVTAEYTPNVYKITYETDGGDLIGNTVFEYTVEDSVALPLAEKEYYTFEGWFDNIELAGESVGEIAIGTVDDKTFYAKWREIEYVIEYELDKGINAATNTNDGALYRHTASSPKLVLSAPTKCGYTFVRFKDGSGNTVTEISSPQNLKLYAEWRLTEYSVTYELFGGINAAGSVSVYTIEDGEIILPTPLKIGYDFIGWYDNEQMDGNKIPTFFSTEAADLKFYAKWCATEFNIRYVLNGGINNMSNSDVYTLESGTLTLLSASKAGYSFCGWYKDVLCETDEVTELNAIIDGNVTLYAKWSPISYKIVYHLGGGINSLHNSTAYTVESGDIILEAPTRTGYSFDGWYDNREYVGEAITIIDISLCQDIDLYAKWSAIEFNIIYHLNGGINNAANPTAYTVESNSIILKAPSKFAYTFDGWYNSEASEGTAITNINTALCREISLYAKWTAVEYGISYVLYGGVNNKDNPISYTIENENIILKNPSKDGYTFDGWYDSADFEGDTVAVIECTACSDIILYAKWTKSSGNKEENPTPPSVFTVETIGGKNIITACDYTNGYEIVIPDKVDGLKIEGIAVGVLTDAHVVEIQAEIETLDVDMFADCSKLRKLVLPCTITVLPHGLLRDCVALEELTVPFAGDKAFADADGVYYPLGVLFSEDENENCYAATIRPIMIVGQVLDNYFDGQHTRYIPKTLTSITILDGNIINNAMFGFTNIRNVTILGGGTQIGELAFRNCSLDILKLSSEMTDISEAAIRGCKQINKLYVSSGADIDSIRSVLDQANLQATEIIQY